MLHDGLEVPASPSGSNLIIERATPAGDDLRISVDSNRKRGRSTIVIVNLDHLKGLHAPSCLDVGSGSLPTYGLWIAAACPFLNSLSIPMHFLCGTHTQS